jgi:hypothetical protein
VRYLLVAAIIGVIFRMAAPKRNAAQGDGAVNLRRFLPKIGPVAAVAITLVWLAAMAFILFVV